MSTETKQQMRKMYSIWEARKTVSSYNDMLFLKQQKKKSWKVLGLSKDEENNIRLYKARMGL